MLFIKLPYICIKGIKLHLRKGFLSGNSCVANMNHEIRKFHFIEWAECCSVDGASAC